MYNLLADDIIGIVCPGIFQAKCSHRGRFNARVLDDLQEWRVQGIVQDLDAKVLLTLQLQTVQRLARVDKGRAAAGYNAGPVGLGNGGKRTLRQS